MQSILKYFPSLSDTQINQYKDLENLYNKWNSKINVISRKNLSELYLNHVLHSLSIAKFISFKKGTSILDIGTGGGFPGIPLAILFPEVNFLLVDSIGKKIKVVNRICESIKLKNVLTRHIRAEEIDSKFDFIVSRAVTNMKDFKMISKGKIKNNHINEIKNGIISLKGGDLSKEMKNISHESYNISNYFSEDFFKTKKIIYIKY
ncbi:MAG: 16S rRNA (guanine(527)-N(7))-methyltransferase RsmG [Flavobacteriales bacterium]|jgi:16S rRNA (guanine527-N7)-methyltransferase|nr:16S rRNA (guanine(527)-N(7))-methyltransferase RsmG [Flavobacteriales bacterium]MDC0909214.1 16S rRNA (guanine(527)-N(7))-methyltransferase RsmG [Flavobacteriales bacterium]